MFINLGHTFLTPAFRFRKVKNICTTLINNKPYINAKKLGGKSKILTNIHKHVLL